MLPARGTLGAQQVGKLLHELHNKCPLAGVEAMQSPGDDRQLIIYALRSALQQLIDRAVQGIAKLLESIQRRRTDAAFPSANRFLLKIDHFRKLRLR